MFSAAFHSAHLSFMCCTICRPMVSPSGSVWLWPVSAFTHSYRPA